MNIVLQKSPLENKRFRVYINNKQIDFGSSSYSNYTMHNDDKRKQLYINRHQKREDWTNPYTAGFWSRWLLWNKPTIEESIKDINKMLGTKQIYFY
jgi:hypothetical protein